MSPVAEACRRPTTIRMPSAASTGTSQRVIGAQSWAASSGHFPGWGASFFRLQFLVQVHGFGATVLPQQVQHCLEFAPRVHITGLRAHFYAAAVDLAGFIALAEFLERLAAVK